MKLRKFWKAKKTILMVFVTMLVCSGKVYAGNHNLKIVNTTTWPLKVKWYCNGKHKDSDKMLWKMKDTKFLGGKKCKEKDLTVKLEYDWTVNGARMCNKTKGAVCYGSWYLFPYINPYANMYPATVAGSIMREFNYLAIKRHGAQVMKNKTPCLFVGIDPLATYKGMPMPFAAPC